MKRAVVTDLARWEAGELTRADLEARHPGDDIGALFSLHHRCAALATEPVPDVAATWDALEPALVDHPTGVITRLGLALRRPIVVGLTAGALGGGVAYAAGVDPVRAGIDSAIDSLFGGRDSDKRTGDGRDAERRDPEGKLDGRGDRDRGQIVVPGGDKDDVGPHDGGFDGRDDDRGGDTRAGRERDDDFENEFDDDDEADDTADDDGDDDTADEVDDDGDDDTADEVDDELDDGDDDTAAPDDGDDDTDGPDEPDDEDDSGDSDRSGSSRSGESGSGDLDDDDDPADDLED